MIISISKYLICVKNYDSCIVQLHIVFVHGSQALYFCCIMSKRGLQQSVCNKEENYTSNEWFVIPGKLKEVSLK